MTWTQLLYPKLRPSALIGGAAGALDAIATVDLTPPVRAEVVVGTSIYFYQLRTGVDAESSPDIIRPDDYAAVSNEKVWEKLTPA